jgi:hypothetical protein
MYKLAFILLLSSCSFLIDKIETPLVKTSQESINKDSPATFCPIEKNIQTQLTGSDIQSQALYLELIKNAGANFDFLDHFAIWNLLQFSIRPDQSSPTSRLQVFMEINGKSHYFDFFSEEPKDQYPFFYGLEWILSKFGKKRSLEYYALLINKNLGNKIKVNKEFELFLVKNLPSLKANTELSPYYFRGTDVLKENETSPFVDYLKLVGIFRQNKNKQKIIVNTSLIPFTTEKGSVGKCNYDFNLYLNSIYLIDKVLPIGNIYGISQGRSAFLSSSSQKLESIESLHGTSLFQGESKVRSSAACLIENEDSKIWAFSNQSRDPGQHLFQLVRYGLARTQKTIEVDKLIRHSRHLFLSDPTRLIIESKRSSKNQIENLLKFPLPIYNAEKLGNIWSYTQFKEGNRFIIDDRNPGSFSCQ